MSSTPHDALVKELLGRPEQARGAIRAALPVALSEALDWSTLTPVPGSFVDPKLRDRHTDLLFTIAWYGAGEALVYVLFEHQSTSDDLMAFRLLRYIVLIWESWLRDHPNAKTLPIILPVVLYHGERSWSAPMALGALLDLPEVLQPILASHVVRFTYWVDDLSTIPDDQLRVRAMSALGRLVEVCLKHARTRADLLDILSSWVEVIRDVASTPTGLAALELVMRYILRVNDDVKLDSIQAFFERAAGPEAKETIMTVGERLIQEGVKQGEERGKRSLLLQQLRRRFGPQVDAEMEQRLAAASREQIELWADRVLFAATLRELLAD